MYQSNSTSAVAPKITLIQARKPEIAKLRVAAYARVSSDSEDQQNSYIAQVDYYTRHIAAQDSWELADIYADVDTPYGQNAKAHKHTKPIFSVV